MLICLLNIFNNSQEKIQLDLQTKPSTLSCYLFLKDIFTFLPYNLVSYPTLSPLFSFHPGGIKGNPVLTRTNYTVMLWRTHKIVKICKEKQEMLQIPH